ncbi:hypothetical protein BGX31_010827 [Mortierella sp. GBA43]|nr:hypothetical protein BGX31_010827 [Mortierella sp. GBA43]
MSSPLKRKAAALNSIDTSVATHSQSPTPPVTTTPRSVASPASPSKKPLVFKKPTKHQFSWTELAKMVADKDLGPMGRSEAVQESYQKAIKRRTRKYGSPDEYIRQKVLHWPPAEKDDGSVSDGNESSASSTASMSPPSSPTGPVNPLEIALKKNEFPYSVQPGIEHWLIWSQYPLTDEDWIQKYLEERLPGRDFLFFINPPELRSVPSIHHVQVFTKGKGEVLDEKDIAIKRGKETAESSSDEA